MRLAMEIKSAKKKMAFFGSAKKRGVSVTMGLCPASVKVIQRYMLITNIFGYQICFIQQILQLKSKTLSPLLQRLAPTFLYIIFQKKKGGVYLLPLDRARRL
jgi:hypothetical protein